MDIQHLHQQFLDPFDVPVFCSSYIHIVFLLPHWVVSKIDCFGLFSDLPSFMFKQYLLLLKTVVFTSQRKR
jgi:hypothetical protein